jgi:uncharacterized protein (UPF0276 family)
MTAGSLAGIRVLGSGLGYRAEIGDQIQGARADIDFVEIIAEQYTGQPAKMDELRHIAGIFPVIPHGIGLSVGSPGPIPREQLASIRQVSDITRASYYSDHLCMTRAPGIDLGHLTPLWWCDEVLATATERVHAVQDFLGKPLALENITYPFSIPHGQMSEAEFFTRLTEATGCGILFDLTNLYTNSVNHCFDPAAVMDEMPLDYVVQVHIAGGEWHGDRLVDRHSQPVPEEVWQLLSRLCQRTEVNGVILEQDDNLGDFTALINQVERARSILRGC